MNMKTVYLYLALAGLTFIFSTCSHGKTEEKTVQTVKTDTVRVYGEKSRSVFPGKVKAASDVNIAFRIGGPVAKVYADVDCYVKKGESVRLLPAVSPTNAGGML